MKRKKSLSEALSELAYCAVSTLIISANKNIPPDINVPYLTILINSGRLEEAAQSLRDSQIRMEKERTGKEVKP